jgi:chromosome segregation ATPase
VLSRSSDLRLPRWSALRLRLPPRLATPVLVVSALLCGLAIGSAVFATLWQRETTDRRKADQALAQERTLSSARAAEIGRLQRELQSTRRAVTAVTRTAATRKSLIVQLDRSASGLLAASGPLQGEATSITSRAGSLSALIRTLDNDLASLSRYVSGTDASTIDPAFLQAQLAYLKPSLSKVEAAATALSGQASHYSGTVRTFVRSASAYASAVKHARRH